MTIQRHIDSLSFYSIRIICITVIMLISIVSFGQFLDVTDQKNISNAMSAVRYGSGIAAADYDNDGDIDLYITTERNYPDYLYQNENGNFTSIGSSVGLNSTERSRMALWLDIDGDKDLDLLVVGDCNLDEEDCEEDGESNMRLYRQDNGQFTNITGESDFGAYGPKTRKQVLGGLVAGDINLDGYIDIVQVVNNGTIEAFINDGIGNFTEQAEGLGMNFGDHYYWQPFLHDFNNDGLLDIYCNVDFGENQFWINSENGLFTESGKSTKSNNSFNEMGITLGDIDNDGDFDIYSTNSENYLDKDVHNILLRQNQDSESNLLFEEVSKEFEVNKGGWGWGTTFFDYNNDGLIDLAATNGWDEQGPDQSKLWIQNTDHSFSDESSSLGFDDMLSASSLISLDFDRDGDIDMIQSLKDLKPETPPIRLLENQIEKTNLGNYLVIKPRMNGPNHFSIGATVSAYIDDKIFKRIIHSGTSFYGQEPAEAFFGLGNHDKVDSLNITWPGGEKSWWYDLNVNESIVLNDDQVVHRPSNFKASNLGRELLLTWNDLSINETGYLLQKSTSMDFNSFDEFSLPSDATSYLDSDIQHESTYFYRLKAFNDHSASRFTSPLHLEQIVLSFNKKLSPEFEVYPNPANYTFIVKAKQIINSFKMFDLNGKEIQNLKFNIISKQQVEVDATNIQKGIYILKLNHLNKKIILN